MILFSKFYRQILITGAGLVMSLAACGQNELPHDCGSDTATHAGRSLPFKYCIDRPVTNFSGDVMFYFHGLNADEQEFSTVYAKPVLNEVAVRGEAPVVISVSFGPLWFLTDADTSVHPALHDLIVNTVIPQMEAKLSRPVRHRLLMGESMGGFNAIQLLVKNSSLFMHAVLLCPAISTLSPWATDDDLKQYAAAHDGVINTQLLLARQLAQTEFPTPSDWNTHNPLQLARSLSPQTPPFFISGGTKDEWGFYEGQRRFADLAQAQGAPVTWMSIPDQGHCVQTADSLKDLISDISKAEHQK